MPANQLLVGDLTGADSSDPVTGRAGRQRDTIVSELHGRFYEQNFRNHLFSGGLSTLASINAATFTIATLGATCTPILGVWNPSTSAYNLAILQASLNLIITALQNTGVGGLFWATSTGNTAITLGAALLNRKTFGAGALSGAKDMSNAALTGLTNNLVVRQGAALGGGNAFNIATLDTAVGFSTLHAPSVENIDGSWIVPPGGILALLAGTTPVAHSANGGFLIEETPV